MAVDEDESVCLGLSLDMTETQCMHQCPNFASQPLCPLVVLLFYSTSLCHLSCKGLMQRHCLRGSSELLTSGGYLEGQLEDAEQSHVD